MMGWGPHLRPRSPVSTHTPFPPHSQVLIIFSYAFYMYSRRPLDPREVEAHFAASAVKAGVAAQGFDAAAHARLASDVARYRRYLDRQQSHGK